MKRAKTSYRNKLILFPKIILMGFLLFSLLAPLIAQETDKDIVHIGPVADSLVYDYSYLNWNKTNWGKYQILTAGWHSAGGEIRTFLKFDLSAINLQRIDKAMLCLYHNQTTGAPILKLGIHNVTGRWAEGLGTYPSERNIPSAPGEITWVAQPPFEKSMAASFSPGAGINKYVEVDVTELVNGWLSGKPNYGLVIAPMGSLGPGIRESGYGFYSREHGDKTKHPVLIVQAAAGLDKPDEDSRKSEPSAEARDAYQRYISAYNKLTSLMARGEGDTPAAQTAYKAYKEAKDKYEASLKAETVVGGVTSSKTSAVGARGNWWMFMRDPQHTGSSSYRVADKPKLKWKFNMHKISAFFGGAVIGADGTIYCGSYHSFYALNPDGSLRWKYDLKDPVSVYCTPAIGVDGTIYFGTARTAGTWQYHGAFYALTPDGNLKWKHDLKSRVLSSPAIGPDGTIYVAEDTGAILYAFDPDGTVKRKYAGGGYLSSYSPAIGKDGTVYFPTYRKLPRGLVALDKDFKLKWEYSKYHVYNVAIGSVNIGGSEVERIYFGSEKYLCAMNTDGQLIWKCATPSGSGTNPAVGPNGVIYFKGVNEFYAIHPDGRLLWKYLGIFKGGSSLAIDANGTIIFGNSEGIGTKQSGAVYALNPDGSLKWRYPIGDGVGSGPTITADGTILIGCNDGYLYAIGSDKAKPTGGSQAKVVPTPKPVKKDPPQTPVKKEPPQTPVKKDPPQTPVKKEPPQTPSSMQDAYDKYIAAYKHLIKMVVEVRIIGPPEMQKLSDAYHENLDKYKQTNDRRAYQSYIADYNKLTSAAIKIELTWPESLKRAQQDYFSAKAEYDRLVKQLK